MLEWNRYIELFPELVDSKPATWADGFEAGLRGDRDAERAASDPEYRSGNDYARLAIEAEGQ